MRKRKPSMTEAVAELVGYYVGAILLLTLVAVLRWIGLA